MNATVWRVNQGVWVWAVKTPHYDPNYIKEMKDQVPSHLRKWSPNDKVWLFKDAAMKTVFTLLSRHFGEYTCSAGRAEVTPAAAFAELHLLPSAPPELVKVAYRTLAKLHHPDVGGSTATMRKLNSAYKLIEDSHDLGQKNGR
jgi:hypothetical protein